MKSIRVAIDARLVSGEVGGVEQFIIGLASGLSQLDNGSEEYLFLAYPDSQDWISPFLHGSCRILTDIKAPEESPARGIIKRKIPALVNLLHRIDPRLIQRSISQENSNG